VTEGVTLELTAKDKTLIADTARTRQCQCQLCEQLRPKQRRSARKNTR
jgi:hypothetical protein